MNKYVKIGIAFGAGAMLGNSSFGAFANSFVTFTSFDELTVRVERALGLNAGALNNQALEAQRVWLMKEFERLQAELKATDEKLKLNAQALACLQDYQKAAQINPSLPNRCGSAS